MKKFVCLKRSDVLNTALLTRDSKRSRSIGFMYHPIDAVEQRLMVRVSYNEKANHYLLAGVDVSKTAKKYSRSGLRRCIKTFKSAAALADFVNGRRLSAELKP